MLIDHKDLQLFLAAAILRLQNNGQSATELMALQEELCNRSEQMEAREAHLRQILETGKEEPLHGQGDQETPQ